MKFLITYLIILILFPCLVFSQNQNIEIRKICDSIQANDYDSVILNNQTIEYKILSKTKAYYDTKKQRDIYHGEVLIPKLNVDIDKIQLEKIFNIIGKKHMIDELIGFRNCKAQRIFYQAMKHLPDQEEYLKNNCYGKFTIK